MNTLQNVCDATLGRKDRSAFVPIALVMACGALFTTTALAQVQRSGGGGGAANAQLMMQYQQASTERDKLQADNTKLKKDLDDLKKQLEATNKQVVASKAGVSRDAAQLTAAQAANERTSKELADYKVKVQEVVKKFGETITQMRGIEAERTQLRQQLDESKAAWDVCAERNYQLYQVDNEVLDRYSHQSAFGYVARVEPFTRIKRTQIDNYVLEYKERGEELRLKKQAASSANGGSPPIANQSSGTNAADHTATGASQATGINAPASAGTAAGQPAAGTNMPASAPTPSQLSGGKVSGTAPTGARSPASPSAAGAAQSASGNPPTSTSHPASTPPASNSSAAGSTPPHN